MSIKTVLIIIILSFLLVVGLAFFAVGSLKPAPNVVSYSESTLDKPTAETNVTFFDLGDIKLSDVKRQDYTLKNAGTKPLQILNVTTSCGCTAGQLIYNQNTSKEFSMHNPSGFVTEIAPGDTATVRLIYRPAIMPVSGIITRDVYIMTNDPKNQKLIFTIRVRVS